MESVGEGDEARKHPMALKAGPGQTSPEVQNRVPMIPQKGVMSSKKAGGWHLTGIRFCLNETFL